MKLPLLLLAALALPAAGADYYLLGNDTGGNCSLDGAKPAINDKYSANETLTLDNVYVPTGHAGELRCGDKNTKVVAGRNWVVAPGARLLLNIGEEGSPRNWTCSATVTGEGTFGAASGINDTRVYSANSASATGSVTLTGDLTGFAGRLSAGENGTTWTGNQANAIKNLKLVIGAASALPQATPDGDVMLGSVCVTNGATISFACNATSVDVRGWTFGSGAVPTVHVDSGKTVTIQGPVQGTVGFKKTGAGTLVLDVGGDGASRPSPPRRSPPTPPAASSGSRTGAAPRRPGRSSSSSCPRLLILVARAC